MGWLFYVIAAIIFFLTGVGSNVLPNGVVWGLFCVALGLALDNYGPFWRRPGT